MVAVISCRLLDGCCYFLEASGWLLLFVRIFWMVAVISWRLLGDCCYFLEGSGWLLLFLGGLSAEQSTTGTMGTCLPNDT